jgi:hypothetical protein
MRALRDRDEIICSFVMAITSPHWMVIDGVFRNCGIMISRVKPKILEKNLLQFYFFHHEFHLKLLGNEPKALQREAFNLTLLLCKWLRCLDFITQHYAKSKNTEEPVCKHVICGLVHEHASISAKCCLIFRCWLIWEIKENGRYFRL